MSAKRVDVTGRVQGVGFRPTVARLACELSLAGRVENTSGGATIWLEGAAAKIDELLRVLPGRLPAVAAIAEIHCVDQPERGYLSFEIDSASRVSASESTADAPPPVSAIVPVDVRTCDECLDECRRADDRRRGDLMISCTQCGPRYSLIERLPYERADGAMRDFAPCPACAAEYAASADRRFHAQTVSCPACGPHVWLTAADSPFTPLAERDAALRQAIERLRRGQILALKGLGGYQLLVDATSPDAVRRLRRAKHRPHKPLAVLVADLAVARRCARPSTVEEQTLASAAGPIVLVPRRDDGPLARDIFGELDSVGLMLPTTALHAALADAVGPLVITSGNDEGTPLVVDVEDAARRLAAIADCFLHHDRRIVRPIDDSVVRVIAGRPVTIRLARGFAPGPLAIPRETGVRVPESVVALGAHQKSAVALWNGAQAILGPHVGELDAVETRERYVEQLDALRSLYRVDQGAILCCDRHPNYFTSRLGRERTSPPAPLFTVLHHHAHIAAAMLEHEWLDSSALGVAWDGTGWGEDSTVWGGEISSCTATGLKRVGRLRPLLLPGGELAIRQPWRTALWMVRECREDGRELAATLFGADRVRQLAPLGDGPWPGIYTSSIGRLFDAAAAIILPADSLLDGVVPYEGAAAMLLEAYAWQADQATDAAPYPFPLLDHRQSVASWLEELDWRPLFAALVADRLAGVEPPVMARRFHETLVAGLAAAAQHFRALRIALGGGVFQNRWLVERLARWADERRLPLIFPAALPPNDGGIAAGQLAVTLSRIAERRPCV